MTRLFSSPFLRSFRHTKNNSHKARAAVIVPLTSKQNNHNLQTKSEDPMIISRPPSAWDDQGDDVLMAETIRHLQISHPEKRPRIHPLKEVFGESGGKKWEGAGDFNIATKPFYNIKFEQSDDNPADRAYLLNIDIGYVGSQGCFKTLQGHTVNTGSHDRPAKSTASPSTGGGRGRVEKRGKRSGNIHNAGAAHSVRKRTKPLHHSDEELGLSPRFACPFFKFDRVKHLNCLHFQLKRVKDVKQHIFRKHSFHCPRCFKIFPDCQKCEEHMKAETCQPNDFSQEKEEAQRDSISEDQKLQLSSRTNSGRDECEQWFTVWSILFPEKIKPFSPYLGSELEEVIMTVRELWDRNGSQVITNFRPTICLNEGSPNNMIASCVGNRGGQEENAPEEATTRVGSYLRELSRVSVPNPNEADVNSAFWGAEPMAPQTWYSISSESLLYEPPQSNIFDIPIEATWGQTQQDTTTIALGDGLLGTGHISETIVPQYQSTMDAGNQEQRTEEDIQAMGDYFSMGWSTMPSTEGTAAWDDDLVGPEDLDFSRDE
ncbi:hypothetical protein EsH8_IV_001140 [Colletotrichum jinshuiense]